MKLFFRTLSAVALIFIAQRSSAQCGVGFTSAQLNWDNLDYFFNSGTNIAPYGHSTGSYISDAQEQTQKFAIGKTWLSIVTSSPALVTTSENTAHTGELAGYTGADVQYNPSANGQTITITFASDVNNVRFTLYDIDASSRIDIDAYNAASVARNVSVALQGTTILTRTNNNSINTYVTANGTSLANNDNQGSATVTITATIRQIVLTATTIGSDPVFWLSDINACVSGTFPNNYQQTGSNQPFTGPTVNQPDYFIATADNDAVYMIDPATGNARHLFTDADRDYVNSFAYDPYNRILYYVSENTAYDANNKQLKKYDFTTETTSVVLADVQATLGIPMFNMGIESAGAAFYDGALYLGIEGGKYDVSGTSNDRTRETIVWRIDFDAGLNPVNAYQVFSADSYLDASNTSIHDWGDFVIKNGVIYNFNTARSGTCGTCYAQSKYHHYNLMTGAVTVYNNPSNTPFTGQAALTWAGNLYYLRNIVARYNEDGTNDPTQYPLTVVGGGPAWVGGCGDASEAFRPKCDFGDAPASYDPNPVSPAVHEREENLRLGSLWDREWTKTSDALASADGGDEDGLPFVNIFNPAYGNYLTQVNVFNNTGANATVCAWLDYNGNGVFDASEGITVTVPTNASMQSVYLYWPSTPSSLANGSYTYLRIRVTTAASGMTTSHPTGYFSTGEVEDYRVAVNSFPLNVQLRSFDAKLTASATVLTRWSVSDEADVASYAIERSRDRASWELVNTNPVIATNAHDYSFTDNEAYNGVSYYRLRILGKDGKIRFSDTRRIDNNGKGIIVSVLPNPVISKGLLHITSYEKRQPALVQIFDSKGALIQKDNIMLEQGATNYELPVALKMSAGSYTVRIQTTTQTLSKTIIVSR